MPNIANIFKAEIARVARKELKSETQQLRKTVGSQRTEIAALKRRVQELEKVVKTLGKAAGKRSQTRSPTDSNDESLVLRFRAAGMTAHRKRLGLSASEFGRLIGVSGQAVYLWESGRSKPRRQYLPAIAELRGLGKREVAARLASLTKTEAHRG